MGKMKSVRLIVMCAVLVIAGVVLLGTILSAALAAPRGTTEPVAAAPQGTTEAAAAVSVERPANGIVALAMALAVASGALGAAYAVAKVGSAAIGAVSERPELVGRALIFVVIAEGIAVWGLVGAILLLGALR